MSFALTVKQEILNNKKNKKECEAFLFGMLLTCKVEEENITLTTSMNEVGDYLIFLLKKVFGDVDFEVIEECTNIVTNYNYIVKDKDYVISNFFDITNVHSIYKNNLHDDKLISLCIGGNFIVRGSVNDPFASYHLEFLCNNLNSAIYIQKLINGFDFNAKLVKRRERLIVYIKESDKIVDLIRIMGAASCAFNYESKIIERGFKNNVNRKVNCDIANEEKTFKAANEQLKHIQYLEFNYPLERLDPKLLLVMKVRKENQEASLNELVEIIKQKYEIVISKPGLSHRFSKIKELALEHQKGTK